MSYKIAWFLLTVGYDRNNEQNIQQMIDLMVYKLKFQNIQFKDSILVCNESNNSEIEQQNELGNDININVRHEYVKNLLLYL